MEQESFNPDILDEHNKPTDKQSDKPKKPSLGNRISSFFVSTRLNMLFGLLFAFAGFFMIVSFISFIKTGAIDQSRVINESCIDIAISGNKIENVMGSLGAYVSELFINKWFGFPSFIIALWMLVLGIRLFGAKRVKLLSFTLISLVLIAFSVVALGVYSLYNPSYINYGGETGNHISTFLINLMGLPGTLMLLGALLFIACIIFLGRIMKFISKVSSILHKKSADNDENDVAMTDDTPDSNKGENESIQFNIEEQPVADIEPKEPENDDLQPIADTDVHGTDGTIDDKKDSLDNGEDKPATVNGDITIAKPIEKSDKKLEVIDPTKSLPRFKFPPIDLLRDITVKKNNVDIQEQEENKRRITEALNSFDIDIKQIDVCVGPTITLFEIIPADGVRISKIKNLENDIALKLAALGIRIIAPIPGRGTIGIEVPNREPQTVSMRSIIESKQYKECKYDLPMAMGCTISNKVFIADLCKMPHLLVAGATGQGKSVGLNAIITSLIYRKHPAELKFVLIDPKMVEFSLYSKLEHHYLAKMPGDGDAIITDVTKVVATLNSLTMLMDNRYELLKDAHVRNIKEYNAKYLNHLLNPEKGHDFMPYIVVIVDEFSDLIMTAGKEVETPIARIAQKARAVGIHLIIATQRPSTNVITGLIKANFPGRIAFRVSQMVDSRTILDCSGAQQLIGRGDMLFLANGELERVQCAFIDTPEVESVCDFISDQIGYAEPYELPEFIPEKDSYDDAFGGSSNPSERDSLFEEAAAFIVTGQTASTSSLQRRFSIGYNRAGKIMDQLEAAGIVGPSQGGKPRQVLIDSIQLSQML